MERFLYKLRSGEAGTIEAETDLAVLEELNIRFGRGTYSLQVLEGDPPIVRNRMVINQRLKNSKYADYWDRVRQLSHGGRT